MREEEKVLRAIYKLVKGDQSPVHLPVSLETVSQHTGIAVDLLQTYAKVLENHGYLNSISVKAGPVYYYITKEGIAAALNPNLTFFLHATHPQPRHRP